MKTTLLTLIILIQNTLPPSTTVYICRSTKAKKYHLSETCRGLNNCKHTIDKTTQTDAEKRGLTLCAWEK